MSIFQNHVIDPTYFWDAIEEFSFNYNLYVNTDKKIDEYGKTILLYTKQIIRGSLQSGGNSLNRSKDGNTNTKSYDFYCKSLYRIDIDDILEYKNNYYIVTFVQDYDEYGVRNAQLKNIELSQYRDLASYIKYLKGESLV